MFWAGSRLTKSEMTKIKEGYSDTPCKRKRKRKRNTANQKQKGEEESSPTGATIATTATTTTTTSTEQLFKQILLCTKTVYAGGGKVRKIPKYDAIKRSVSGHLR